MKQRKKQRQINLEDGMIGIGELLYDMLLISLLWIICSLPIITIGASTSALYYTTVKVVKQKRAYPVRQFFKAFRNNFKQGALLWGVFAGVFFVLQLNIGILLSLTEGNAGLFFICCYIFVLVFILAAACYAFPVLSRYDMSFGWILKISIYMVVKYLPVTLVLLVLLICILGLFYWQPLFIIILPSAAALIASDFLERVMLRHAADEKNRHV